MIRLTGPVQLIISFAHKLRDDNVSAFSAATTLFIVISFFPFLMFMITITEYLPITDTALFALIDTLLPGAISDYITTLLADLVNSAGGTLIATTAIASLWAGSRGFLAIERGLNCIYDVEEQRNYFYRRMLSFIYTMIFAVLILVVLSVFVFGNQIADNLVQAYPTLDHLAGLIKSIRTVVGLVIMVCFFTFMFRFIPSRREQSSSFLTELPGAIVAALGWIGFSFLYSLYIDNMPRFAAVYGSLTAIVLCILWLYICMYIMFVGAELNGLLKLYEIRADFLAGKATGSKHGVTSLGDYETTDK